MYKHTKKRAKYLYDSAHSLIQKIKIKGNKFQKGKYKWLVLFSFEYGNGSNQYSVDRVTSSTNTIHWLECTLLIGG